MPAIELRGLSKQYGRKTVLREIDLRIAAGQRLALLGSSGAGKSTLLRAIAGLETVDAGSVWLDGANITHQPPHQRGLALMSQDYALYPQLSVRANLHTALLSLRLNKAVAAERCQAALQWFRIADLIDHLPSQLSGGQAQRVALAKALIRHPRWLLLDEPFSQLDGPLREELRELVLSVTEHYQSSLIFVTHDPLDAMRLATQVAILSDGKIAQVDEPAAIYRSPKARSVAELISPYGVNWLQENSLLQCAASPLVHELTSYLRAGGNVGFRPEAAYFEQAAHPHSDDLQLPAVVQQSAFLGFAQLLHTAVGNTRYRCLATTASPIGQTGWLIIPAAACLRIAS